jgi:hypothetical protein
MWKLAALAVSTVLAGCGAHAAAGGGTTPASCAAGCGRTATATPVTCPDPAVRAELTRIATSIYDQAAAGRDTAGAVARVERSRALAAAVDRDDPAATRAALQPLLRADIRRIVVLRGSRVLAANGTRPALGPVRGTIGRGRFVLATGTISGIRNLIEELTGAQVSVRHAAPRGAAVSAEAFPSGPLGLELRFPDRTICGPTSDAALGEVAERLYAAEAASPQTQHVLRIVAGDPRFVRAVQARDAQAVRAQIVRFFGDPHLHVVRIRATDPQGRLINDVGGPYVLAPASTTVRDAAGRAVGTVTLAIQDDAGYIKLINRFTGANVVLVRDGEMVPGSAPATGTPILSFSATAFPSGPLRVSLFH